MGISGKLSALNPFGHKEHGDDEGEALDQTSVAGGGRHRVDAAANAAQHLPVSPALRVFLAENGVLSSADAGVGQEEIPAALQELVSRSHIKVPAGVTDRSHRLTDYFISSSHNTYLLAHQLYGASSASGYDIALGTGARCVEIDAWDGDDKDEPKVTHGFTLVSQIPFRRVCEAIRDVVDAEKSTYERNGHVGPGPAPIFLSLENHCGQHGQGRLVEIMKEVWGDRLLSEAVRAKGHAEQEDEHVHVTLGELGSKICVMVEYHMDGEKPDSESSDSDSADEGADKEDKQAESTEKYNAEKKKAAAEANKIVPDLSAIGVYVQSVKPPNTSWFESHLTGAPHHHLINISESGLGAYLPENANRIAAHNSNHLMRVYPRGTRIRSTNLNPVPFWGIGAQVCALNWQKFGASMQLNEALFAGTDGYVLKPAYLRGDPPPGAPSPPRRRRLRLRFAGATSAPSSTAPYMSCVLIHPDDLSRDPPKRKTDKDRKDGINPMWDETLEWEYDDSELVFLRMLLKSDEKMARNPVLAASALRLLYAVPGWNFIRMLDLGGHETQCSVLVHIDIQDV